MYMAAHQILLYMYMFIHTHVCGSSMLLDVCGCAKSPGLCLCESVDDDRLASSSWTHYHNCVSGQHGLIQLNNLVSLHTHTHTHTEYSGN